jgi:hypothetical protein
MHAPTAFAAQIAKNGHVDRRSRLSSYGRRRSPPSSRAAFRVSRER